MTVPLGAISGEWAEYQRFRDRLAAEIDPALYTVQWLDLQVFTGTFRLFSDGDSAILFSIREYPTGLKEAHGEFAVGELNVIQASLIPQFEAFAKANGCSIAVIQSREGWVRQMKDKGYSKFQTAIRKVL